MPLFTIEAGYRIPIYRHRRYRADTLAEACRLAVEDDDWSEQKEDHECAGETFVTGAWPDGAEPYSVPASSVPSQFGEAVQRKAEHFEVLLDLLKLFALVPAGGATIEPVLRDQAQAAVAKGDAILAGARAPDARSGGSDA